MKALSIKQPWASLIASGEKTIETRTWPTSHRGPLLIVSSKSPPIEPAGVALAIVDVVDCRPMVQKDEAGACCEIYDGAWAWVLANVRPVDHFPVRGMQGLYDVQLPGVPVRQRGRQLAFGEK